MNGGDLRAYVDVQRSTPVDDGFSNVDVFASVGVLRARRRDVSDGERYRAGEVAGALMTRFVVRRGPLANTISTKDRLVSNAITFNITGVKGVGDGTQFIEITCASRTDT